MQTVNKVFESGYKAIWGDRNGSQQSGVNGVRSQPDSNSKSNDKGEERSNLTGIETVDKAVNAGKRAIWGNSNNDTNKPHGEEPISGVTGKGSATDPYDAGNRDGMFAYQKNI